MNNKNHKLDESNSSLISGWDLFLIFSIIILTPPNPISSEDELKLICPGEFNKDSIILD